MGNERWQSSLFIQGAISSKSTEHRAFTTYITILTTINTMITTIMKYTLSTTEILKEISRLSTKVLIAEHIHWPSIAFVMRSRIAELKAKLPRYGNHQTVTS